MADNENKDKKNRWQEFRVDADEGREPRFLSSRMGTRQYSIAALMERIIDEVEAEYVVGGDSDTETGRLKRILGVTDYIVAVESIHITTEVKAEVIRGVYGELFGYGPLEKLFADEKITTIALEGADKAFVRYKYGDLTSVGTLFDDEAHLRKIVRRMIVAGGTDFDDVQPIIETGLMANDRRLRVTVAAPPATIQLAVDIRVHPTQPPSLDDLVKAKVLTSQSATLIKSIAQSQHGVIIVGDTESGKTTLLAVIAGLAPAEQQANMIAVERAGELHLPRNAKRLVVQWKKGERQGIPLFDQVNLALEQKPSCLLLDEVRTDESHAVASLLTVENPPRQMWVFRGPSKSKRLAPALGMLARRSDISAGESIVQALYRRLPFIVSVRRRKELLQVYSISEWQYSGAVEYPDYVELMAMGWGEIEFTGKRPIHTLDLPDEFWG
jgi:Flp pilus assembly CpaF family ATPase